jgi:glycine cleavage system H lipoate-binding protein
MSQQDKGEKGRQEAQTPHMVKVYGFQVPTSIFYLHPGHAWAVPEDGQVRVGVDDFSQKILGPADELKLPEIGKVYYQGHVCMALLRQGRKASILAPVDGTIEAVNPKVKQQPGLIHDDPYGEGWLFMVKPCNLKQNLENLSYGEANAAWIEQESQRLINLDNTHHTLPTGGELVADVFAEYGWRRLAQEFFLKNLTKSWKKRS